MSETWNKSAVNCYFAKRAKYGQWQVFVFGNHWRGTNICIWLTWRLTSRIDQAATDSSYLNGQQQFNWLVNFAKENGCKQFYLDSGVQRFGAHRFYLKNRMIIAAHHFSFDL